MANAVVTKKPECVDPQAIQRCNRAAHVLETLRRELVADNSTDRTATSAALFNQVQVLLAEVASAPEIPWPGSTWPFLNAAIELSRAIIAQIGDWGTYLSPQTSLNIGRCCAESQCLENPRPLRPPKVVRLETIEMLDKQMIPDSQIARMYDLKDENGDWDTSQVWAIRDGKQKALKR